MLISLLLIVPTLGEIEFQGTKRIEHNIYAECNGLIFNGEYYDKKLISNQFTQPYNLVIHKYSGALFFSHSFVTVENNKTHLDFKISICFINTKDCEDVPGIPGGYAIAYDTINEVMYFGGHDGIYRFNVFTNTAEFYKEKGKSIWSIFAKKNLYYIQYPSQSLHMLQNERFVEIEEAIGIEIDVYFISRSNDIYFANKTGLYTIKLGNRKVIDLNNEINVRQIVEDQKGIVYFVTSNGIYVEDNIQGLGLIASVEEPYGLAFDKKDEVVYSTADAIYKLHPSHENEMCFNRLTKTLGPPPAKVTRKSFLQIAKDVIKPAGFDLKSFRRNLEPTTYKMLILLLLVTPTLGDNQTQEKDNSTEGNGLLFRDNKSPEKENSTEGNGLLFRDNKSPEKESSTECDGLLFHDVYYDCELIVKQFQKPYNLVFHKYSGALFFSHSFLAVENNKTYLDFKITMCFLNTKDCKDVTSVPGGFAIAYDTINEVMYFGGHDGIYIFNVFTNTAEFYKEKGKSIWSIFAKKNLYYIEYPSQSLHLLQDEEFFEIEEAIGIEIDVYFISSSNNIYFANKTGLYTIKLGNRKVIDLYNEINVRQIVEDQKGIVYFVASNGIYVEDNIHGLKLVALVEQLYGLAFDKKDEVVYSTADAIYKLHPSHQSVSSYDLTVRRLRGNARS